MYGIVTSPRSPRSFRKSLQLAALGELLGDAEIEGICRDIGHAWRKRQLPPGPTVRSMVYRGLNPDHSIPAVLADLAALLGPDAPAPTGSAWCQARSRLPEGVLVELIFREALRCRRRFGRSHRWKGRAVFRIDGSTVSMPDEPSLVETFGYAKTRHGPSRFPVGRVTFIELAGVEVIWNYRLDEYTCDEDSQLHDMWHTLPTGCICLMDRKFCSFYNLAKLRQRRIGVVCPLHQRRDPQKLIRQGRALGPREWLVPLDLAPQLRRRYDDPSLPDRHWVRLIRVDFWRGSHRHTLWVVTTLLDPVEYPADQIADLYRRRWEIETRIGSLKTTLEMNVLRSKSPQAVYREVAAIILGHNLVWRRIHEAAERTGTPSEDISFAGAVKVVLAFSSAMLHAPEPLRRALRDKMLLHIARQTNHHPFDRVEPRLIKRELARFAYLRGPRWKARLKCLS
jgi:IS4 transposase